jgi:predicted DNA-binding helix-hairpin-helix protein
MMSLVFPKHLFYNRAMDAIARLSLVADAMQFEAAEDTSPPVQGAGLFPACGSGSEGPALVDCSLGKKAANLPIARAVMPGGKTIALLKTLQTSACERDCYYCCFRAGRDFRRATFSPDEMAQAFMTLHRAGAVEGLFLSSGVAGGGMRTQDKLLDTVEILRRKMGFRGYVHLKIMPGAERAQVEQAMRLADRVSVNLEAPNTARLAKLAPHKVFMEELLRPLQWVEDIRRSRPGIQGWNGRWPSTTTQFVVGGAGESDLELLSTTAYLNKQVRLARAYFSRFKPVENTPLENQPATDPWREHRLYQASFLLRDYGFELEELPFVQDGNLPLGTDPKLAWAQVHLSEAPLDLDRAERSQLLRIPGIGPKSAQAILSARSKGRLHGLGELRALGVRVERAIPFVLLDGRRPARQLALF